jgi:hypothetical protein
LSTTSPWFNRTRVGIAWRVVSIDLDQLQPSRQLARELLERRADPPARTAPGRPDINEHWDSRSLCDRREVRIGCVHDPTQRRMALSAMWRACRNGWNAILRLTVGTHHNLRRGVHAHAAALSSGGGPLEATTVSPQSTTSTEVTPPSFTHGPARTYSAVRVQRNAATAAPSTASTTRATRNARIS